MQASEVMTHAVIVISADASVQEAASKMLQHHVSGLPVADVSGTLVGMVTEGDLLRRIESGTERRRAHWLEVLLGPGRMAQEYVHTHGRKVAEVMTSNIYSVGPETPLNEVVDLMERRHIKRVPVLDSKGQLVGIVSRANLLRGLADLLDAPPAPSVGDAELRTRILAAIDKERWSPSASIDIAVKNGVAELRGAILDEREREALIVVAENTPGVKSVVDHLVWVEPMSGMVVEFPKEQTKSGS